MKFFFILLLLTVLKAFNVLRGEPLPAGKWGNCETDGNETIRLKTCKCHLICYKSKMAKDFGTWKAGGRFRVNTPNKGIAEECAGNDGTKGWHGLKITDESNGTVTFMSSFSNNLNENLYYSLVSNGQNYLIINITKALTSNGQLVEEEFEKALNLGAFVKDFEGMALRIAAMEIQRAIGRNDTNLCKTKCSFQRELSTKKPMLISTLKSTTNKISTSKIQMLSTTKTPTVTPMKSSTNEISKLKITTKSFVDNVCSSRCIASRSSPNQKELSGFENKARAQETLDIIKFKNNWQQRQFWSEKGNAGKWTNFPIPIKINDTIEHTKRKALEKTIQNAIKLITENTCISFKIVETTAEHKDGIFAGNTKRCSSEAIGKKGGWQKLSLNCKTASAAAHELMHVLGLLHEQSRSDARSFIKIIPYDPNIRAYQAFKNESENYGTYPSDNFGLPYDFGSLMHYPAKIVSYWGGIYDNIITLPPFYKMTIGQREKPSFKDVALLNRIYCNDSCNGTVDKCQNGGYLNPKKCSQCLCPEGYGGIHCESLQTDQNCEDSEHYPKELDADWQTRKLSPVLKCLKDTADCSCHWRIKPKGGKKLLIQLKAFNESSELNDLYGYAIPCRLPYVEIKYRKDKRAQGAKICASDIIDKVNTSKNWIEADEPGVDIVISAYFKTANKVKLFELSYETDGAKLVASSDCPDGVNWNGQRNPGQTLTCHGGGSPCCPKGDGNCPLSRVSSSTFGCNVVVLSGQYREVRGENESHDFYFECFKREGTPESFWGYWKDKSKDPIRINDLQCLSYEQAGIKHPPNQTFIDETIRSSSKVRR